MHVAQKYCTSRGRLQCLHVHHLQVIFRVEVAQLHPAEELAEGKVPVLVGVAQLEVSRHFVLGVLRALSNKVLLPSKTRQDKIRLMMETTLP